MNKPAHNRAPFTALDSLFYWGIAIWALVTFGVIVSDWIADGARITETDRATEKAQVHAKNAELQRGAKPRPVTAP